MIIDLIFADIFFRIKSYEKRKIVIIADIYIHINLLFANVDEKGKFFSEKVRLGRLT